MRLDDLLARLRGRRSGNGYIARCPAHDDRHPSLSITQRDNRILLHCFRECSVDSICEALSIRVSELFDANSINSNARWSETERKEYARRIWGNSRKVPGTVAETYLRTRGIVMPLPRALRFITLLQHREYAYPFPALVAGLQDVAGSFAAVSITFLCADGSDKAPVEPQRKIYGPYRGAAVRLSDTVTSTIAIVEGIETGLSIAQACLDLPVWCALSANNLARVELPATVREVIIAADNDAAGDRSALAAAQKFSRERREVRIARPHGANDFNDVRL